MKKIMVLVLGVILMLSGCGVNPTSSTQGTKSDKPNEMVKSTGGVTNWVTHIIKLDDDNLKGLDLEAKDIESLSIRNLAYGNGSLVAVTNSDIILQSKDGVHWKGIKAPISDYVYPVLRDVVYGNNMFIAVGERATKGIVFTSTDGLNWVQVQKEFKYDFTHLAFGGSLFMGAGYGNELATSSDGVNWVEQKTPYDNNDNNPSELIYGNKVFMLFSDRRVYTSENGENWETKISGGSASYNVDTDFDIVGAVYGGDKYVACGNSGGVATSLDGSKWDNYNIGNEDWVDAIGYFGDSYVAVGPHGLVATSDDGSTWKTKKATTDMRLGSMVMFNNTVLLGGKNLTLVQSGLLK